MAPLLPHLEALPQETLENITYRLPSDDVFALRLTCSKLESKIFHCFAKRFFTAKCIHISSDSLKALLQISESERLSPHLKELWVSTKWFETNKELEHYGRVDLKKLPVELRNAREFFALDQKALMRNKDGARMPAEKMLTQAFKKLPSMTAIHWLVDITALPRHIDYRGRGRYARQCNQNMSFPSDSGVTPLIVQMSFLMILLDAVCKSGISLTTFKVARARSWHGLNMSHMSICIAIHQRFGVALRRSLTTLHLQLDPPANSSHLKLPALQALNTGEVFPNLRDLELDFSTTNDSSIVWKFCRFMLLRLRLERMTNLSLRHATIKAETLVSVLRRCRKLTELKLEVIELIGGQWITVLKEILCIVELAHLHLMYLTEDGEKTYFFDKDTKLENGAGHKKENGSTVPLTFAGMVKSGCAACYHPLRRQFVSHDAPTINTEFSICLDGSKRIQKLVPIFIKQCHLLDEDDDQEMGDHEYDIFGAQVDFMTDIMFGSQYSTGQAMIAVVHPNYQPAA